VPAWPLQIDMPIVRLPSGSTQTFVLDSDHLNAGKFYWLLGSASGTQPGIPFADVSVLPPDAYPSYTLGNSVGLLHRPARDLDRLRRAPGVPRLHRAAAGDWSASVGEQLAALHPRTL